MFLAALLPDIDEQNSKINKWSGILGRLVIKVFKHRGLLHSLLFFGTVSLAMYTWWNQAYGLAFFIGYLAHITADGITPMGVPIFYPFKFKISGPMRVGTPIETVLTGVMFAGVMLLSYVAYF